MSKGSTHAPRGTRLLRRALTAVTLASLFIVPLTVRFSRTAYAAGDISLNTIGTAVTQNFDSLATSGTTNPWADGTTLTGWYAQFSASGQTANPTTYRASTGTDTTGAIYSFGVAGTNAVTERAFGSVASGTPGDIYYAVKMTNNTGSTITGLSVSFTGEQWRQGGCTPTPCTPASQKLDFQYQVANAGTISDANTPSTGWLDQDSLDFTSPSPGTSTAAAIDGNAAANRSAKSAQFAVTVANGQEVWLRWKDSNDANNDHGLAIDDFSVTPLGGSIGATGVRTTDIQGTDDGGYAMVLQPDGKIVVGGYAVNMSGNKDFALARYNYDGTLDTTFNGTGKVTTDFNSTSDRIWGLALQSDNKIVAVGETVSAVFPGTNDIAIARYNTNGTLDNTFGGTGKVTTDHGGGANNAAYAVAMSGTNIVVAGYETVSGNNDFMIAQYNTLGVLDATFGTLGVTTLGFSGGNDVGRAVAIDSSNRIVVGGYANNGSDDDFAVARFTSGGVLDTSFVAGAGKTAVDIYGSSADQAFGLAITPTGAPNAGTIVLAGSAYNPSTGNKDFALVRYTSAGGLDTGFGGGTGIVKTDFVNSPDIANAVYVRSDGFITAAGSARFSASSDDFAIARYTANGSLDTTFNGTGKLTMRINNGDDRIYAVAREFDGKIVAAGFTTVIPSNPVQHDFALARFNADGSLDSTNPTSLTSPDLLLTKTFNPDSVTVGDNTTATISVTNRGPGNATNVVITDTLPAGLNIVSTNPSGGAVQVNGQTVTYTVGSLAAGSSATLTVTLTTTQSGLFFNTASVTSTETDLSPGNNTDTASLRVAPQATVKDLSFSPSTVFGGCQNSTATVTLTQPAPGNGALVTITSAEPSAASAPAQVLVPGGQTSAQFTVTTSPVVTDRTVRFEATYNATSFVRRLVVKSGCF